MEEIIAQSDMHSDNQKAFGLPSRLIAKVFLFRLVYGGSAYSYAVDPAFKEVGFSERQWQKVIDAFYEKYKGWAAWHRRIMQEVTTTGRLVMPTGRVYKYERNSRGDWPRTTILNYPVQGLGADLLSLARVRLFSLWRERGLVGNLISTVHDSIVADVPSTEVDLGVRLIEQSVHEIPQNFEKVFGVKYNLPIFCETEVGMDYKNMEPYVCIS